ncbi:MAG: hypothetical protein IJW43_06090 [Clostridia bacterium]|nr:hypothetical protein [Clostridia bacterium]
MDNVYRSFLFSPTSIRLPNELYNLIDLDAWFFGFRKNSKSNINGFLNELLPSLATYREETSNLISTLTEINEETANQMVSGTFSFDALILSFINNNGVNVSLRVNKSRTKEFIDIYDNHLREFDMDFSTFVRSALLDYVSKRRSIRERLLYFKQFREISLAMQEKNLCFLHLENSSMRFIPTHIIVSPKNDCNFLFGLDTKTKTPHSIALRNILSVSRQKDRDDVKITSSDIKLLEEKIKNFLREEKL